MKTLKDYCKEAHKTAKEKGFWDNGERNLGELLMLVVSELGEALEAHRNGKRCDALKVSYLSSVEFKNKDFEEDIQKFKKEYEKDIKGSFEEEIADTFIRLFDLCEIRNIDIEEHIELKMKYNETRERLHGKKY